MNTTDSIREKLETAFRPTLLDVVDDSDSHRGHGGWREGGETHFNVKIVSAAFEGKGRVERQRMVYRTLADELAGPVHALSLDLAAPGK